MDADSVVRLRRVITKLARQLNASGATEGLAPSQASALGLIVARGPLTLPELTAIEDLNPTMVSRVVSKLEAMDLVRRVPDPDDLRTATVETTAAGRKLDRRIKAQRAALVARGLDSIDDEQRALLLAALPVLEALTGELQGTTVRPSARA
jgi:DNA-binding MarR family transcriptional regulator